MYVKREAICSGNTLVTYIRFKQNMFHSKRYLGFEVIMAVSTKMIVFLRGIFLKQTDLYCCFEE